MWYKNYLGGIMWGYWNFRWSGGSGIWFVEKSKFDRSCCFG